MTKLHDLNAAELAASYASAEFSPSDVCAAVLARIEECEPTLNAFYQQDAEGAIFAAAQSTQRWLSGAARGPLDGVPVTIKENIARKGVPMPAGTALPNPPIAVANAPIVDRLVESGAVILGSTTMPDWGMLSSSVSSLHGISRSPWNPDWTTGGSSAGARAAAAAAAGYGPLHLGTDIGGSIRLPGTWLGLATLKPSAGLVPLDAPYLGRAAGPIARNVSDAALLLSVVAQFDARDFTARPYPEMELQNLAFQPIDSRVGIHLDAGAGAEVDDEIAAAVLAVAEVFAKAGAKVASLPPFINQQLMDSLDNFWRTRSYRDFAALTVEDQGRVLPYIARWCARGSEFDGATTISHYEAIAAIQQATVAATWPYDLVISPVAPMAAFGAEQPMPNDDPEQTMGHIAFTAPYNMSDQPAATVNCGFTADGRPIGVQIAGRVGADQRVLSAAAWYEANRPESAIPDWAELLVRY